MIELAEVINELREELDRARRTAVQSQLRFELGPVELEVTVALEREGKAGGKVKFWVVEAGTEGRLTSAHTQRISLTLQPTLAGPDGSEGQVSTEATSASPVSVYVGGTTVSGER